MTLPASQALTAATGPAEPGKRRRLDSRTLAAIRLMVWDGLNRRQAAESAGITDNGLYVALRRPEVKHLYLAMVEELRLSHKARNIHAAVQIRDQSDNDMARMQALRWLDALPDQTTAHRQTAPGVVLQIVSDKQQTNIQQVNNDVIVHTDGQELDQDPDEG